jgi:putative MATE family efflux protein
MTSIENEGTGADLPPEPRKLDRRLVEGRITPTLVRFAAPLLFTNLMVSVSGTWTAVWVSHLLGPDALTAVVNANILIVLLTGIVLGVGSTAGIAVAQAIGAEDLEGAKRVAANALIFALTAGALLAALGHFAAPWILAGMRLPPSAREPAIAFLATASLWLPGVFALIFMMMMLRGTGDARTPFIFTLLAIVIALVTTPAFLVGAPGLGIAGAAWSGVVANTAAAAGLVAYVYAKRLPLALGRRDLHLLRPDPALLWMLIRRGTPVALESIVVNGAYFVLLGMVNAHGPATAAAYSAAAQLWGYVQMPAIALATSMSAMAAQNIGAGRWDRVDPIAFGGCLVSCGFTTALTVGVYALGDLPLLMFLPQGGEALAIARSINLIVLWGWIVLAITLGLSAMVRANGAMVAPTIVFAITMWLLRVPFASLLQPTIGVDAIWWSFPLGSVSSALLAFAFYRWGSWRGGALMTAGLSARSDRA